MARRVDRKTGRYLTSQYSLILPQESRGRMSLRRYQDDAIQWICDAALPSASLHELCMRILYINISAIHTTSTSIVQAVYDLAAHIEFKDPIRDEIKCALRSFGGWTKCALNKMHKLDSSLKESQRLHPVTIGPSCPLLSRQAIVY